MSEAFVALGHVWIFAVAGLVVLLLLEVVFGTKAASPCGPDAVVEVPSYVVLMPAHDESGTIESTVAAVRRQLPAAARLLVIADNCTDATAAEARAAGAEVAERRDPALRGKGYALAFGVEQLRSSPPDVVVVLDADCVPAPGALDLLAARARALAGPVQGLYLMSAPPHSPLRVRMAAFAWAVKNQVRPSGLHRLGLPCQLMGSGMAFPWACIEHAELGSSHLTEDIQLGMKLAQAGQAPSFCQEALVESWFPQDRAALQAQRRRWEHGHLSTILACLPDLVGRGMRRGGVGALALAWDLCIPPLALLALLILGSFGFAAGLLAVGADVRLAVSVAAGSMLAFVLAVLLGWWSVGRRWVRCSELLLAPAYIFRKLPVYAGFLLRRQKDWVRTSRER